MINKVILMGRLTADPELRQTQSNISSCRFAVAVQRAYQKQGEERQTDFINIIAWRQTAEFVAKYFEKGSMIIVEGSLNNNNYEDKNGVKHYSMIVLANNVSFGESKKSSDNESIVTVPKNNTSESENSVSELGDLSDFEEILGENDLPF